MYRTTDATLVFVDGGLMSIGTPFTFTSPLIVPLLRRPPIMSSNVVFPEPLLPRMASTARSLLATLPEAPRSTYLSRNRAAPEHAEDVSSKSQTHAIHRQITER